MLSIIVLIPALWAAYVSLTKSPQLAFLNIYLPVLLLVPDYYRWIAPGLPDPTFSQGIAVAIGITFMMRGAPGYKFSITDIQVFGFALVIAFSEYLAAGYKEAQNLMFDMLGWVVFPYILVKSVIEINGLRVVLAKRIALCMFILAAISLYESRFGQTPFRIIFDPFFPGQGRGWVTTFRWGLARVAGPYGHAILAGVMFLVAFRIQRWLEWSGAYPKKIKQIAWFPIPIGSFISLGIFAGVVLTLVKGPWISGFLAAMLVAIGRAKNRLIIIIAMLSGFLLIGIPGILWFIRWAGVGRENATSVNQETAAYRFELIENYMDIAYDEIIWGWGRNTWPKVLGQESIDNYYLLLFLMHGAIALLLLLSIIFGTMGRLIFHAMKQPPSIPPGSSLGFTLASIYVVYGFSIATVFLGLQTIPMLFIVTGWADAYLRSGKEGLGLTDDTEPIDESDSKVSAEENYYGFRRVIK